MNKLYKTPVITSIVMLFLALFDLPAGYFTLLRIIVCGTAVYFVFIAKEIKKLSWVWVMGFIAILFNPFIPIHLDREMWGFIDIIVAFIFFSGIFALSGIGAIKFLFQIWLFAKKIYKKELAILISTLLIGFIVIGIAGLFPPEPKGEKVPEPVWALVIKMWNYKERRPEYKKLSALEIAEKLSKENPEYQKDYDNLKAISEENGRNKKFDIATAKPVEETLSEKISGLIKSYLRSEKITKYGFFFVLFGYPIILFARFIIWTVRIPKEKPE